MLKRIVLSVCAAVAAVVMLSAQAGETYTWKAGTNGNWEDAANWSVGGGEATAAPSALTSAKSWKPPAST